MQKINPRILLAIVLIPMGLIIAMVPEDTAVNRKVATGQILQEISSGSQFVSPDEVARLIIEGNPALQLIDVRSSSEFDNFSLPGAVNIPLTDIMSPGWRDILDQDVKINVFYSNGAVHANEALLLTRQQGYINNYVLQGGLNYWMEAIVNPDPPSNLSPDEEFARYDFRRAVNSALGGESAGRTTEAPPPPPMPSIRPRERTPVVTGGC